MEYRKLGASGLMVPALSLGTGMFVPDEIFGTNNIDQNAATRMVDVAIDHGLTMFDTAHSYWDGHSETLLGKAISGRRDKVIISTKAGQPYTDSGINGIGGSRHHLVRAVDESLKRLGTDYIDVFQLHTYDAATPVEETLGTLDDLVSAGKLRYVGVSNTPSWALMKALGKAEQHNLPRYVVHQVYYSLVGRDYEWDLMPLGIDQNVSAAVWSPLGWGRLSGKIRRDQPLPKDSRLHFSAHMSPPVDEEVLYRVTDILDEIAEETGKSVPQIAINWLLQRPTVATVIIGPRTEEQLLQNIGSIGWSLTDEQISRLDAASATTPSYPTSFYPTCERHRNPPAV